MSFEEKLTWVNATTTVIVVAIYAWLIGGQLGDDAGDRDRLPAADDRGSVAMIVLTIVGAIVTAIGSAVGAAVRVQITGEGSMDDIDLSTAPTSATRASAAAATWSATTCRPCSCSACS